MDPSALIFIALAVAWAVYLVPKALEHHEESVRSRTVEKFSATMRVLASREPISRRRARLVRTRTSASRVSAPAAPQQAPIQAPARTPGRPVTAARTAARRRRRVVTLILLVTAVVAVLAALSVITWWSLAAPLAVLGAWLIACRLMVKRERRGVRPARDRAPRTPTMPTVAPASTPRADEDVVTDVDQTGPIAVVPASSQASAGARPDPTDPQSWDPVPVTLPTYVSKPVAPRSVRQIDLDSTGVWTSGRSESDSELVRESQAQETKDRDASGEASARRRRA